jgi:ferredoxin
MSNLQSIYKVLEDSKVVYGTTETESNFSNAIVSYRSRIRGDLKDPGNGCSEDCYECIKACPAKALQPIVSMSKKYKEQSFSPPFVRLLKSENRELSPGEIEILQHVAVVDDHIWYQCIISVLSVLNIQLNAP